MALLVCGTSMLMATSGIQSNHSDQSAASVLLTTYDTAREGIADILGIAPASLSFTQTAQTSSGASYDFTSSWGHSGSLTIDYVTKVVNFVEATYGSSFIIIKDIGGF